MHSSFKNTPKQQNYCSLSLLSSYLVFSKVLWQEDSDSSNQSSLFENKYSNTLREAFRGDPNLWNTSGRGESSSPPLIWSTCSWRTTEQFRRFQARLGIQERSSDHSEAVQMAAAPL